MIRVDTQYVREVCKAAHEVLTVWRLYRERRLANPVPVSEDEIACHLHIELKRAMTNCGWARDQKTWMGEYGFRIGDSRDDTEQYIDDIQYENEESTKVLREFLTSTWHMEMAKTWDCVPVKIGDAEATPAELMEAMALALDKIENALLGNRARTPSFERGEFIRSKRVEGWAFNEIVEEVNMNPGWEPIADRRHAQIALRRHCDDTKQDYPKERKRGKK
jgi:hypothetical protein